MGGLPLRKQPQCYALYNAMDNIVRIEILVYNSPYGSD